MHALDAASGRVLWTATSGLDSVFGDLLWPAADDGQLYLGSETGEVIALDLAEGRERWRTDVRRSDWVHGSPLTGLSVSGDTVYAAIRRPLTRNARETQGVIVAFDRITGRELWRYATRGRHSTVHGPPVIAGRNLVVNDPDSASTFAVDRFTGTERWRVAGDARFIGPWSPPIVAGDTVFVGSMDSWVYAIGAIDGRLLWKTQAPESIFNAARCGDLVIARTSVVHQFDSSSGRLLRGTIVDTNGGTAYPRSGFATWGDGGAIATDQDVVGFRC